MAVNKVPAEVGQIVILGITGAAGTGKSTLSFELARQYGFHRLAFADPVKGMVQLLLSSGGMSGPMIERHINGDLKEQPCDVLEGKTARYALQTLGTEWGRHKLGAKLWTHHLEARLDALLHSGVRRIVVDDVRMDNEAKALTGHSWLISDVEIWCVQPHGEPRRHPPAHASEEGIDRSLIDQYIRHDFTMSSLRHELAPRMEGLGIKSEGPWHHE